MRNVLTSIHSLLQKPFGNNKKNTPFLFFLLKTNTLKIKSLENIGACLRKTGNGYLWKPRAALSFWFIKQGYRSYTDVRLFQLLEALNMLLLLKRSQEEEPLGRNSISCLKIPYQFAKIVSHSEYCVYICLVVNTLWRNHLGKI